MSHLLAPQIVILKEGTEDSDGRGQIVSNINACQAVVDVVKTTLGKDERLRLAFGTALSIIGLVQPIKINFPKTILEAFQISNALSLYFRPSWNGQTYTQRSLRHYQQ